MPSPLGFGFRLPRGFDPGDAPTEYVVRHRPLLRVLAFRGRSIDDVVNSPVVKAEIRGYWKLHRHIQRRAETLDLERQWNPLGTRTA